MFEISLSDFGADFQLILGAQKVPSAQADC